MATRIGLRLNPVSGSGDMIIPFETGLLNPSVISIFTDGGAGDVFEFIPATLTDASGGVTDYHTVNGSPLLSLKKTVSAASPWTSWYESPTAGLYDLLSATIFTQGASSDIRLRLILEVDGLETVIFNDTAGRLDSGGDGPTSSWSSAISMTITDLPAPYSDFWTGFIKTQENEPS